MNHRTAISQALDPVFPEAHPMGKRIFLDRHAASYYDAGTDLYVSDRIVEAWASWHRPRDQPIIM